MGVSQSVEAKESPVPQQQTVDDRAAVLLPVLLKSSPRVQKALLGTLFNTIDQLGARNEDLASKLKECTDSKSSGQWVMFVGGMVTAVVALIITGVQEKWLR